MSDEMESVPAQDAPSTDPHADAVVERLGEMAAWIVEAGAGVYGTENEDVACLNTAAAIITRQADKIEGLEADLHEAVAVAHSRGAERWAHDNYPAWADALQGRVGTHGFGCHTWGPRHYDCALVRLEEVAAALRNLLFSIDQYDPVQWHVSTVAYAAAQDALSRAAEPTPASQALANAPSSASERTQ